MRGFKFIHDEYYLTKFLEKRIAYHHGQLPHIIRNLIEKLFRDGEINFIFCTPTLVEGVNMPTKNIFINCDKKIRLNKDKTFNPNKIIAFWNLAGRAGRYRKELSGNIFCIISAAPDLRKRMDDLLFQPVAVSLKTPQPSMHFPHDAQLLKIMSLSPVKR